MKSIVLTALDTTDKEPKGILLEDLHGNEIATVYCDGEMYIPNRIMFNSDNWQAVTAVATHFNLFFDNLKLKQ